MSLRIIKAGIFDSIQDQGRYGFQHIGINPGGCMDRYSSKLANALLGKDPDSPVIEMHFPASTVQFQTDTVICLTGADMKATINDTEIPLNTAIPVKENSILKFNGLRSGWRGYLSILHNLNVEKWLSSYSTNSRVVAGGFKGRELITNDVIEFEEENPSKEFTPYDGSVKSIESKGTIRIIRGKEFGRLAISSRKDFLHQFFSITKHADRMGYRLHGKRLVTATNEQLVSSPVAFGTIQLLPDGQLIILMAEHQTIGGYPRIAYVISADLPVLAQMRPGDYIKFEEIDVSSAQQFYIEQQNYLNELRKHVNKQ